MIAVSTPKIGAKLEGGGNSAQDELQMHMGLASNRAKRMSGGQC